DHDVGVDWPVGYDVLEPYFVRVEAMMEVAGGDDDAVFPRSAPLPHPPHRATRAERRLMAHDRRWVPMPTARSNGGSRPTCCATGACNLCPIDAKFTVLNGRHLFEDEGFAVLLDTEARRVDTEAGRASGLEVRGPGGEAAVIAAPVVALGANAMSNAAILLRSGIREDLAGRGLHEQASQFAWIDIPFDNYYGGTSITGLGYGLYDGDFRGEAASVLIESWNAPPSLRLERGKWLQRLKLKLIAEDLPDPENRVVLENDEIKVIWNGHSDYAYRGLARARDVLSDQLPFEHEIQRFSDFEPTEAHIQGGTPMGDDPATSVVDSFGAVHGVGGLHCLGAGVFPTCSAANPTLTLSALSLRAGESL
ncbi:MAG: GMC oxidoreductase, partial [Pseudomonadota bacterium]